MCPEFGLLGLRISETGLGTHILFSTAIQHAGGLLLP